MSHNTGLLDLFTPLVVSDSTARHKAGLPSQSPSPIVSLYNHILNHLAMLATSEDLQKLDWPAPEFARAKFASKSEQASLPMVPVVPVTVKFLLHKLLCLIE